MSKLFYSADWHITATAPEARLETDEEWRAVQIDAMRQVKEIVGDNLFINAGDLVHVSIPKDSNLVTNMIIDNSPKNTVFTSGNHELLGMSQQLALAIEKGALGTLIRSEHLKYLSDEDTYTYGDFVIYPFNFQNGRTIEHREVDPTKKNIAVGHFASYSKEKPFFMKDAVIAEDIIEEFPEFDLIIVGDIHSTFIAGNKYVSPGSLTRRTISQVDHKPCIHSWDGEKIETYYLKVKPAAERLTREHIEKKEAREGRMEDWVEGTENISVEQFDFEEGCRVYARETVLRPRTEDRLFSIIERSK